MTTALAVGALGCEDNGVVALTPRGTIDPLGLDFGDVPVQMTKTLPVVLRNTGSINLELENLELPPYFAVRGFKDGFAGTVLQPGSKIELEVIFAPVEEGPHSGIVKVAAKRAAGEIELTVTGNGLFVRLPDLIATPAAIDFGAVEINTEARANFTITNNGTAPGTIDGGLLQSTQASYSQADTFFLGTSVPVVIGEGETVTLEAVFAPKADGAVGDVLSLTVAEGTPNVNITLNGQGAVPFGEIFCEPGRLDFGQVERGQAAQLTANCTARGGPARLLSAGIEGAAPEQFAIPSPPNTSDLQAEATFPVVVEFRPAGLPATHSATMVVQYSGANGPGTAEVQLTGEVIPPPPEETAITVEMSWSSNNSDVDLHMVRNAGGNPNSRLFESTYDCYFSNRSPEWGVPSDPTDNPFLDVDDVDGRGPEKINIERSGDGTYDVFVHFWSDASVAPTTATALIYLSGTLAGTFTKPDFECNDVWHVGTITWMNGTGTFNPVNADYSSTRGFCF